MHEQKTDTEGIADEAHCHSPSAAPTPIERLLQPFHAVLHAQATGGLLLLGATVLAMGWANSPWAQSYFDLWHYQLEFSVEQFSISHSLHHWINDGLMAVFFFVVGLEIKRELLVGELASPRRAALPIAGAIGGMLVPASLYAALNAGGDGLRGWGIPMATDIAFAVGIMALLGRRVPTGLKIFVTALAIVDDLGAVLVIALFYTGDISFVALGAGGAVFLGLIALNLLGVRHPFYYAVLGAALWMAFLQSGVHATVAGVLAAMTVPARTRLDPRAFLRDARKTLEAFEAEGDRSILQSNRRRAAVATLEAACEHVQSPMQRLEHSLFPWVKGFIMPVFALANAGVPLDAGFVAAFEDRVALGVIAGLLVGKPVGIVLCSWFAVRWGIAELPPHVNWRRIVGAGLLGGIGFTMSLFIANLAFDSAAQLGVAKAGILVGSLLSAVIGCALLRR